MLTRCQCAFARIRMITYVRKINPVVHVRVRWIMETRKELRPSMHLKYDNNGQMLDRWSLMEEEAVPGQGKQTAVSSTIQPLVPDD